MISFLTLIFTVILCWPLWAVTLIQGISTPVSSLDPFSVAGIDTYAVTGNVIEPLARSNPLNGEIVPVLAQSWTLDPKNKTFRVKLRDGVRFHNGQKLTAEDVRFTFDAYFKPEYRGQMWQSLWADIESVRVIDPLTAEFKMKRWRYQAMESVLTSLRILPKSFYHPADKDKFHGEIVGSGPFKFKRFKANRTLELQPFADWWGGAPPKHALLIKHVTSADLAAQLLSRKELDFYAVPAAQARAFKIKDFKLQHLSSGLGHGFWLDLNQRKSLFQSPNVRRALALVWRREDLNKKVFGGELNLALDVFSPSTDIYPPGLAQKDDLKKARELLAQEGWRDEDKDSVLENSSGQRLEFTVLVNSAEHERWVTLFQKDAALAGIKVHVSRVEEDAQWLKRLEEGKFEAFAGSGGLMNEPTRPGWHSSGPYNYGKFSHQEVDRLTEQLEGEFDLKKRRLILRKLIEIIREQQPQLPGLFSAGEFFLTSKRLHLDPQFPTRPWLWKVN